jgi:glycolate oxidase FAD binding subunit
MEQALGQLIDQVRAAYADRQCLSIQGGGTKSFYGHPVQGQPLSTLNLKGIVSYEPSELVVTVKAGTSLTALQVALAERGQYLPFEPPEFSPIPHVCTVGGAVAAGLSGPARASVGALRDYVLGLDLINGQGQWLQFGGQVMKNVAGYDISRLMAGSWGTLGVITQVSLKVLPVPPADATLVFELPQALAIEQINRWCAQPLPINASCWVQDESPKLFVRLRGAKAAVEAAGTRMLKDIAGHRMNQQQADADWRALANHQLAVFHKAPPEQWLWRVSVPSTQGVLLATMTQLIEWHGALRWIWAPQDAADLIREAATRAQGFATLFHARSQAVGPVQPEVMHPMPPPLDRLHRDIKRAFDPATLFNRGRLSADL